MMMNRAYCLTNEQKPYDIDVHTHIFRIPLSIVSFASNIQTSVWTVNAYVIDGMSVP